MRRDLWIRLALLAVLVVAEAVHFAVTGRIAPRGIDPALFVGLLVVVVAVLGAYGFVRTAWLASRMRREAGSDAERRRLERLIAARARGLMDIDEVRRRWREGGEVR